MFEVDVKKRDGKGGEEEEEEGRRRGPAQVWGSDINIIQCMYLLGSYPWGTCTDFDVA